MTNVIPAAAGIQALPYLPWVTTLPPDGTGMTVDYKRGASERSVRDLCMIIILQ